MRRIATTIALCGLLPAGFAQGEAPGIEGRRIAETLFATVDVTGAGAFHTGDLEVFRRSVLAGMDADGDGSVPYAEFAAWDPGFARVAASMGRTEAHVTASKIVFAFRHLDGDGALQDREMRNALARDFRRADLDEDGFLSRDEFIGGFPVVVAMRAAIRPDL